jgi:GNAT superfamily N-acetyltransferase
MIDIRSARTQDLAGILELYRELRPADPTLSQSLAQQRLRELIENPLIHLIVVDTGEQLVGTCMLSLTPTLTNGARPFGMIEHVVTANAVRGKGIGKQMLRFAIDLAWQHDCYKVMLLSGMQRIEAHGFYENLGFRGDIEKGYVLKPSWDIKLT